MNLTDVQRLEQRQVKDCVEGELAEVLAVRFHLEPQTNIVISYIDFNNLMQAMLKFGQLRGWLKVT
jgi:hypothetical protein